jgi:hypothetical protein
MWLVHCGRFVYWAFMSLCRWRIACLQICKYLQGLQDSLKTVITEIYYPPHKESVELLISNQCKWHLKCIKIIFKILVVASIKILVISWIVLFMGGSNRRLFRELCETHTFYPRTNAEFRNIKTGGTYGEYWAFYLAVTRSLQDFVPGIHLGFWKQF